MRENLLKRLDLINKAIERQHRQVDQANYDLTMLQGARQEIVHIMNMPVEPVVEETVLCEAV